MIVGTAKMITGIPTVIAGTPAVPILLLMQFIYLENFEESFLQFVPMGIASSFSCLGYRSEVSLIIAQLENRSLLLYFVF